MSNVSDDDALDSDISSCNLKNCHSVEKRKLWKKKTFLKNRKMQ